MPVKVHQKKIPVCFAPNQTLLAIMDCLSTCIFTLTPLLITFPFDFMWISTVLEESYRDRLPLSLSLSPWKRTFILWDKDVILNESHQQWASPICSYSWWWHFSLLPLFFLILARVSSQFAPFNKLWYSFLFSSCPLISPIMNHASRNREMLWTPQLVETMVTGDTQLLVTSTFITKRTFHPRWYVCDFAFGFFWREILPLPVKWQLILILLSMSL